MTHRLFNLASVVALAVTAAATAEAQTPAFPEFHRVIAFGDSLTDPGNRFALTGDQSTAPFAPVPSAPYAAGNHHYSNGETWLEQLTRALGVTSSGKPAFRSPGTFWNYAYGGATAGFGSTVDLSTQVARFLQDNGNADAGQSLVAIWIGSNDTRAALAAYAANLPDVAAAEAAAGSIIEEAITLTALNIMALHDAGTRNFLILNVPNLANIPAVRSLGPGAMALGQQLSSIYNSQLDNSLDLLGFYLPGANFTRLDARALLDEVVLAPADFDLVDAASPCLSFFVLANPVCSSPDTFLFWDALHPTRAGHAILSAAALAELTD